MTENIYQPRLWIDGELLNSGQAYAGEAALDRLKIKWGAKDWYELVDAATLTVTVRTFTPGFGAGLAERQARVTLTRAPDDRVMFRGKVSRVKSSRIVAQSKAGTPMTRYEHVLTVADPLDELNRDRRRGMVRNLEEPNSHWGPCTMQERRFDLQSRIEQRVWFPKNKLDDYNDMNNGPAYMWPVTPYELSQTVSTLTVLRNTLRIRNALARPMYRPASDDIVPVHPTRQGAGAFSVMSVDGFFAYPEIEASVDVKIPGDQVSMPAGVGSETTAVELVTGVEIAFRSCKMNQIFPSGQTQDGTKQRWEWNDEPQTFSVERRDRPALSKMTVKFDCDDGPGFDSWDLAYGLPLFEALNFYGAQQVRPLRYAFDKVKPAPDWAADWLDPFPPSRPGDYLGNVVPKVYRLSDSATNDWPVTEAFSIVGGEMNYSSDKGWIVEVFPAVVARSPYGSPLKLKDLADDHEIGGTRLQMFAGVMGDYAQARSINAGREMKVSMKDAN